MNIMKSIPAIILMILSIVLMVLAIVDIVKSDIKHKFALILLILLTGIIGCFIYFVFIKRRRIKFDLNKQEK
jgi:uncharacterized membrane protein